MLCNQYVVSKQAKHKKHNSKFFKWHSFTQFLKCRCNFYVDYHIELYISVLGYFEDERVRNTFFHI